MAVLCIIQGNCAGLRSKPVEHSGHLPPPSESFQLGQRDERLLAEDFPGRTEADLRREAE